MADGSGVHFLGRTLAPTDGVPMTAPQIRLYKAGFCPYCIAASRFLREVKGVELEEIDLTGDNDARMALVKRSGGKRTVPQIWIGDVHVGGYDELRALDARGELDPLLSGAATH